MHQGRSGERTYPKGYKSCKRSQSYGCNSSKYKTQTFHYKIRGGEVIVGENMRGLMLMVLAMKGIECAETS